jgi:uncharacterized membrane protein
MGMPCLQSQYRPMPMPAVAAPSPWPAPAQPSGLRWQFGQQVWLPGADGQRPATQWVLRRNCSLSPGQCAAGFAAVGGASLAIALGFLWAGAPYVLAFAGLELLVLGAALVAFSRHATDRETLTLDGCRLQVERRIGPRTSHAEFDARWLSIEPVAGQGSLIRLAERGRHEVVGRFLSPALRSAFASELRHAVRQVRAVQVPPASLPMPWPAPGPNPRLSEPKFHR